MAPVLKIFKGLQIHENYEHLIDHSNIYTTVVDKQSPPMISALIDCDFLLPELMHTS